MTLLLLEGFDWFETADLPTAYGILGTFNESGTPTVTIEESGGRNGDKCLRIASGSGSSAFDNLQAKSIAIDIAAGTESIIGFAVKFVTLPNAGNLVFAAIDNGGIGTSKFNISLIRLLDGTISAGYSNGQFYAGSTGSTVMSAGIWYYIELKFTPHVSTGAIEIRINENIEFTLTNINTQRNTNNYISFHFGLNEPATTLPVVEYDDFYICDALGSENNDYLGDIQVKMLTPDGNGNTNQFTGSDANSVDNYLLVDDGAAPDDDTTWSENGTSGQKDLYTYTNLPSGTASVKGVAVKTIGKKVSAGPDLKAVVRSNVTESDSANFGLGTSYLAKQVIYEQDPNTASAWTESGVNAIEAGVKVV